MATPTCELCGGTEFVKSDGMFVCQGCGTKYSPEEAQQLMKEEAPESAMSKVAQGVAAAVAAAEQARPEHPHHGGHPHGHPHEHPHGEWREQELRSAADFNSQAVNVAMAGARGVNNYVCQAWQLTVEEYKSAEHPNKERFDALIARAKECLVLLNSAAIAEPNNYVQNMIIYGNCVEIEKSAKDAKYWTQAEDGSWKGDGLGPFEKVEIAGQNDSWGEKRRAQLSALEQIYFSAHQDQVALKQQLKEEAAGIQAQLDELKDEKRSKGFFNFKEKGEVKERMRPVKDQLAQVNREINEIDNAAENYAEQQVEAAANAYVILDF